MTSKEFAKRFQAIADARGLKAYKLHIDRFRVKTDFGLLMLTPAASPRIGVYSCYFRFMQPFDLEGFKTRVGITNINQFSFKWNSHNYSAENLLDEVCKKLDAVGVTDLM